MGGSVDIFGMCFLGFWEDLGSTRSWDRFTELIISGSLLEPLLPLFVETDMGERLSMPETLFLPLTDCIHWFPCPVCML